MFGPDVSSSLTLDEFALVAQARDAFHAMDQAPVDKDAMAGTLQDLRGMFSKSLAVTRPLKAGDILERDTLTFKKPGTGIPASEHDNIVGRRLKKAVEPDGVLTWSDVE